MVNENNSTSLLRLMFITCFIFDVECELANYKEQEKRALGRKLGQNFSNKITHKARLLSLWGYSQMTFD